MLIEMIEELQDKKDSLIISILIDNNYLELDGRKLPAFDNLIEKIKALTKKLISNDIDEIVDDIYNMEIPKMTSGNTSFKSNKADIKAALKRFTTKFEYDLDVIRICLLNYIEKCIDNPSIYNPSIRSYIHHQDKGSRLADDCESYMNGTLYQDEHQRMTLL